LMMSPPGSGTSRLNTMLIPRLRKQTSPGSSTISVSPERNLLAVTLSAETMGLRGLAILLSITLEHARRAQDAEPLPDFAEWPKPASEEAILGFLEPTLCWMAQVGPVLMGSVKLTRALVPPNPDSVLTGLLRLLEHQPFETRKSAAASDALLGCAMALAPHGTFPKDVDISMLRLAAVRMAPANRYYRQARNHALQAGCKTVVASPWPLDSRVPSRRNSPSRNALVRSSAIGWP
jgi:hypothetical protein